MCLRLTTTFFLLIFKFQRVQDMKLTSHRHVNHVFRGYRKKQFYETGKWENDLH